MISWNTLGVDSAPRLCEDWWFGNGILGSTKKNGRYSIESIDSWKAEACTVDPDDSTRCIEKHPCALPLWSCIRCDVEEPMEPHGAPFSTGPAVCLMIAKRKVGAGTDAFESWRFWDLSRHLIRRTSLLTALAVKPPASLMFSTCFWLSVRMMLNSLFGLGWCYGERQGMYWNATIVIKLQTGIMMNHAWFVWLTTS